MVDRFDFDVALAGKKLFNPAISVSCDAISYDLIPASVYRFVYGTLCKLPEDLPTILIFNQTSSHNLLMLVFGSFLLTAKYFLVGFRQRVKMKHFSSFHHS